jgi:predicted RecA/RadA family phage recombinase
MAKNFIQDGKTLTLVAPTGGVTSGLGYFIGALFVIALQTVSVGGSFNGRVDGVFDLPKLNTQVWTAGERIYWDVANSRATNIATGSRHIGIATEDRGNPSTTGYVALNGVTTAFAPGAPSSYATAGAQTYTAADVLSGTIVRDPAGASRTDTLPTAALLVAAIPGAKVGDVVDVLIVNGADAAETITIAAGTGGSFDANQTAASRLIAQNSSKLVRIRLTNVTASSEAYVVYA